MDNALGEPQTILLLGGSSDIGLAIVRELLTPSARTVLLGCRNVEKGEAAAAALRTVLPNGTVEVFSFDGLHTATHAATVRELAAHHGDIDVAIVAFGELGDNDTVSHDGDLAAQLAAINFGGAMSSTIAVGEQMRAQGHGAIVVLSSVAGVRVRSGNLVYGATKAGLDGFALGLGDALAADGVHVMVVRPGFVHSAMTAGLEPAPFATTPSAVAQAVVAGLRRKRTVVWAPGILRIVFSIFRLLPTPIWRRLPVN
jgi:decaprenylphospho-beta-D-erythro-pentofuranosid-2-ulose 2-reductase